MGNKMRMPAMDGKDASEKIRSRGTQDDLEIMRLVILENRGLLNRVLDRMRGILSESDKYGKEFKSRHTAKKPVNNAG